MWRFLSVATFVELCLAMPAPQQDGSWNSWVRNVFNQPPMTAQTVMPARNLDSVILDFHRNGNNGTAITSGTMLGIQNKSTPSPDNCKCVPYYQCKNGKILEDGVGLIDIRLPVDPCENYLDVCCEPPDIVRRPEDKIVPIPTQRRGCGQRHPEGVGFRIIGQKDNEAEFGEFPWMVAILKEESVSNNGKKVNVYQCGGALIHERAVLTAAHCVNRKQPSELRVRAGEWDTQTKNEVLPYQNRNVETVIVHEKFHSGALSNDYAILILTEPVEFAENVDIVCLADTNTPYLTNECFASGWGKDVFGKEGHYQVILKKVSLPIVPHKTCENALRKTRLGEYFTLHESFVCAGGEPGKDTCKGDGGSPLVCPLRNDPTRYVQVGIVAWGVGCGKTQTPGVYANVPFVRRWIDEQMAYYNLDNTVYKYRE